METTGPAPLKACRKRGNDNSRKRGVGQEICRIRGGGKEKPIVKRKIIQKEEEERRIAVEKVDKGEFYERIEGKENSRKRIGNRDINDHKWWGFDIELIRYRTETETFGAVCVLIER